MDEMQKSETANTENSVRPGKQEQSKLEYMSNSEALVAIIYLMIYRCPCLIMLALIVFMLWFF